MEVRKACSISVSRSKKAYPSRSARRFPRVVFPTQLTPTRQIFMILVSLLYDSPLGRIIHPFSYSPNNLISRNHRVYGTNRVTTDSGGYVKNGRKNDLAYDVRSISRGL